MDGATASATNTAFSGTAATIQAELRKAIYLARDPLHNTS
jgi:hypothetical protein